ncbi:zf-CGNR multi-domain protein [Mycolicibacterium sp. P9-64]|uniref:CGNR zinc finger domain-containing protein n=1 Tax=Mycolicibacterium sp. P9-64 TaxID=2024612 RepID=UPI0011EE8D3B|nr:CGNR zinc finger domain-containing protein [Mycolicibacterium sp. P9-64]KAA0082022.1 zf-CGNR multi-domain protein [Mycolicibacterium sp. P9-64]
MPSIPEKWLDDEEKKPAPEPLRRVQSLINTLDRESGLDRLAAAENAAPWMTSNGLLPPGGTPTDHDLRTLIGVREGLRALVLQNTDGRAPSPALMSPLHELTDGEVARAAVADDGAVRWQPVGDSVRARLLTLVLIVSDAQHDGTWAHLLACANDDCQWVFYDRSRNHGGTWCDMATCGNKLKNRDFRARVRSR